MIDKGRVAAAVVLFCVLQVLFWYLPYYVNAFVVPVILYFMADYRVTIKKDPAHLL